MAKRVVIATDSSGEDGRSVLEESEIEELRQIFAIYDSDNDGRITGTELNNLLKAIGLRTSSSSDTSALAKLNETQTHRDSLKTAGSASKSEKIDVEAVIRVVVEIRQAINPEAEFREAFAVFDTDGDGFLTAKELKAAMLNLGEKMTDDEIYEMINVADHDADGKVNYDEFMQVLANLSATIASSGLHVMSS